MASIEVYESLTRPPSAAWRASIYRGVRDKRRNPAIMNMLKCGIRGESQRRATGQGLTSPRAHRDGRLNCSHSPSNPPCYCPSNKINWRAASRAAREMPCAPHQLPADCRSANRGARKPPYRAREPGRYRQQLPAPTARLQRTVCYVERLGAAACAAV
jgi:hypothetical protein